MSDFVQIKNIKRFIDYSVRGLCCKPYYNHKNGCPNFGKRDICPPQAPKFEDYYDLSKRFFVIYTEFDLESHVAKLREKHPQWSKRQLYCCYYWQKKAVRNLDWEILNFKYMYGGFAVTKIPEAMGINVDLLMKSIGIELEWMPKTTAYKVAIAGVRRRG
jgi:predicted metal-binding protein